MYLMKVSVKVDNSSWRRGTTDPLGQLVESGHYQPVCVWYMCMHVYCMIVNCTMTIHVYDKWIEVLFPAVLEMYVQKEKEFQPVIQHFETSD